MKYLIYLFTVSTIITSCCTGKKAAKGKEETKVEQKEEPKEMTDAEREAAIIEQMKNEKVPNPGADYYEVANKEIPKDAFARIQKTPCFGRCPVYVMTIYQDGRVDYFGKKFVEKEGRYVAKVSNEKLEALKNKAKELGFFEMDNVYDKPGITDLPSVVTTVKDDDGFKTVVNRFDSPEKLRAFEKYFEESFKELEWEKVEN